MWKGEEVKKVTFKEGLWGSWEQIQNSEQESEIFYFLLLKGSLGYYVEKRLRESVRGQLKDRLQGAWVV